MIVAYIFFGTLFGVVLLGWVAGFIFATINMIKDMIQEWRD